MLRLPAPQYGRGGLGEPAAFPAAFTSAVVSTDAVGVRPNTFSALTATATSADLPCCNTCAPREGSSSHYQTCLVMGATLLTDVLIRSAVSLWCQRPGGGPPGLHPATPDAWKTRLLQVHWETG